jgi:hypothetical protein
MTSAFRLLGSLAVVAGLAACAEQTTGPASVRRIYYADTQGKSAVCTAPQDVRMAADKPAEAAVTMSNEGGWCGVTVSQSGPKPYDSFMLTQRPQHGRVLVRAVGDYTRVDYFPDRGFTGSDVFTVRFVPGSPTLQVKLTVQPGPATAAAAPAATPAAAPAATPARAARR